MKCESCGKNMGDECSKADDAPLCESCYEELRNVEERQATLDNLWESLNFCHGVLAELEQRNIGSVLVSGACECARRALYDAAQRNHVVLIEVGGKKILGSLAMHHATPSNIAAERLASDGKAT